FRGSVFLSRDFVPAQAVIHFIQLIQVGSPRRQVRAPVFLGRDFVSAQVVIHFIQLIQAAQHKTERHFFLFKQKSPP
ncbi:MAG: hypothetical protein IKP78_10155, partial [Ruminococcus sp.]|nr:hypothetical protein [Ruminococcus sp.]